MTYDSKFFPIDCAGLAEIGLISPLTHLAKAGIPYQTRSCSVAKGAGQGGRLPLGLVLFAFWPWATAAYQQGTGTATLWLHCVSTALQVLFAHFLFVGCLFFFFSFLHCSVQLFLSQIHKFCLYFLILLPIPTRGRGEVSKPHLV